jgi:tol-pal system-associated acyl-CoA thioesterase
VSKEFSLPLRVYIEDTDAGGIVYYVNYLKFMERARTEFMRSLGFGKNFIFNEDLMFVVQDVNVRYLQSARLDDQLLATAEVGDLGGAFILMRQTVTRGSDVLARGDIKIVCVHKHTLKPARMPSPVVAALREHSAEPE